jgi:hypothetical protein
MHGLAADPIAKMPEDRGAERAGQETNAVGAEGSDGAQSGIG